MECDFVENAQRRGRLVTLFVNATKTRPVGNQDNAGANQHETPCLH